MDKKIEHLLSQLTLEEKASLTAGSDMWHSTPVERLGIPTLRLSDGPNGVRGLAKDTQPETSASFPVGIAMAATWNPSLIKEIGKALAQEAKSKGVQVILGPTVNLHRAPLAGRNFECFSEDPYLSSQAAIAYIDGIQSQDVAACIKHFVCNDQETERLSISAEVAERALQEIYLPPFRAAVVEADVFTVMSAYNRLNGIYASENRQLLIDILKNDWGFDGLLVSDWYGTYSQNAAVNGCDLEMPGPPRWMGTKALQGSNSPDPEILDDQVRRLLRTLIRTNAFEEESRDQRAGLPKDHQDLIRQTGTEAIVLLKNGGMILPLDPEQPRKIALIGQLADHTSFQGGGSSQVTPQYVISLLEACKDLFKGEIKYAQGYDIRKQLPALDHTWLMNKDPETGPLFVTYYNNTGLAGDPVHTVSSETTSLGWFGETAEHWDPRDFSLRMEGTFQPPESREYTLALSVVGRGRLLIDGEEVVDLSGDPSAEKSAEIDLSLHANREYHLVIEYWSDLDLRWRSVHLGAAPSKGPDLLQDAVKLASESDLAIVVAGLSPDWESEGFDRPSLSLPGDQNLLIQEVLNANPNTIVILQAGSPVAMPWIDDVPGVLQAWYLGQESGRAIGDVLAGKADPGGRLPITFPADIKDTPTYNNFPGKQGKVHYEEGIFVGYRYYDMAGIEPLFPFGHGLSYTSFEYENIQVNSETFRSGSVIEVSVEVTNTGKSTGSDVIQLYLRDLSSSLPRPIKELKGFQKLTLDPGESASADFKLSEKDLAFYDPDRRDWITEPGEFEIMIGQSSENILLTESFHWE